MTVAGWLTNWSKEQIEKKKITNGDIIQDAIIFNRLRNTRLDLDCTKKYFDKKTFKYLNEEVDRLKEKKLICPKCKKFLGGLQIMCHGCLDWYHAPCIGITAAAASKV